MQLSNISISIITRHSLIHSVRSLARFAVSEWTLKRLIKYSEHINDINVIKISLWPTTGTAAVACVLSDVQRIPPRALRHFTRRETRYQKWPGQARPDQAIDFVMRPAEAEEVNNVMLARTTKCGRERLLTLSLTRLRIFYEELPGMRNVLLLIMTMKSNLSIWSIRKNMTISCHKCNVKIFISYEMCQGNLGKLYEKVYAVDRHFTWGGFKTSGISQSTKLAYNLPPPSCCQQAETTPIWLANTN